MNDIPSLVKKGRTPAKQRWRMLARSLKKPKVCKNYAEEEGVSEDYELSVRRFKSFNILSYDEIEEDDDGRWYCIRNRELLSNNDIRIRLLHMKINPNILIGFNNTGNICVWPSEEVLAVHCLKNLDKFRDKTICELGGGMTAIAGFLLALEAEANEVVLTDGNAESSSNIQQIIEANQSSFKSKCVVARQLLWGKEQLQEGFCTYDFVICADCLYFVEQQELLMETISNLLSQKGEAILFAPKRGKTFDAFIKLADISFDTTIIENYDEEIWQKHLSLKKSSHAYDPDIHYPFQLILRKREE